MSNDNKNAAVATISEMETVGGPEVVSSKVEPTTAAAQDDGPTEVEWMMACNEVGGPDVAEEIITRAYSIAELPRSTPAAPGINLDSMVAVAVRAWGEHQASCRFTTLKGSLRKVCEAVIDASPKGGSTMVTDAYATALVQAMRDARAGVFNHERHVIATLNWLENRASKIISEQTTSAEVGS